MSDPDCRRLARNLVEGLPRGQRFLALRRAPDHWTVLHQVGEGWDLQGTSPRLLLLQAAAESAEPCLVMESHNDPRFTSSSPEQLPFRSALCLPLISSEGLFLGAVLLEDPERPRAFQFRDAEIWKSKVGILAQALERLPTPRSEPPFLTAGRLAVVVALGVFCVVAAVGFSRPKPKSVQTPTSSKLQTRQMASPQTVASSFVGAVSRRDYRVAFALTVNGEKKTGSYNHFVQWVERWSGDQRQAWSLQYREVSLEEQGEDACKVALTATGPAQGMPPLHLDLVRLEQGWRLETLR